MLKRLKLEYELKQKRESLKTFMEKRTGFTERRDNLRTALSEAETEQDIEIVNNQIKELEEEIGDVDYDAEIQALNTRCDEIEDELKKLDEKIDAAGSGNPNPAPATENNNERKADFTSMRKRTILHTLPYEERQKIIANEELRSFLSKLRNDLQNRAVTGVQYTVPAVLLPLVSESITENSKLLKHINLTTVNGDARVPILGAAPEAIWVDAVAKFDERDIEFNQIEVGNYKVQGYISVSNTWIDDSDVDLTAKLINALGKGTGRAIDRAILYGNGNRMPVGIATRLAQTSEPATWDSKAPKWEDLHTSHIITKNLTSKTGAAFFKEIMEVAGIPSNEYATGNLFWAMSRKTAMKIKANAIGFDSAAVLQSKVTNEMPVVGGVIEELNFIPDGDIFCGFGELYAMGERKGITFAQSEHAKFFDDETVFASKARYDGQPVFGNAFVLFNINNVAPTTTSSFAVAKTTENSTDNGTGTTE